MSLVSYPGFLGPANKGQSFMADAELLRNWFPAKNESPGAPNQYAFLPCPGFSLFASVSQAPIRGMFAQIGRAFFVAGYALHEMFEDGTTTLRGSLTADTHPVRFSANGDAGNQLWFPSGGIGYNYDLSSNTLTTPAITGTATMGGFLDGRFLYLDADTGAFYASALYDGTTWDASMVGQSESGDPWRALIVTPDRLIRLLGETTGECWANQGTSPFPFSKVQESGIPFGIAASFAWSVDTTVTWLAQNNRGAGLIVKANGYSPERISTHAIEDSIHGYSDITDAVAWGYLEAGHSFTMMTFPTGDQTWVIDAATGLWHERTYWDTATGAAKAYRPGCMMEAFGKTFVGDSQTGDIYEMKNSHYADVGGAAIRRQRQPPRLSADQRRLTIHQLQLVMDTGQGLISGQGSDPQMMVQVSRNSGQTFGQERWTSAGPIGQWDQRVKWHQLGQARNFVPRLTATDPVPWRIVDLLVDYTIGAH